MKNCQKQFVTAECTHLNLALQIFTNSPLLYGDAQRQEGLTIQPGYV